MQEGLVGWVSKGHGGGYQLCLTCVHSLLSLGLGRRGLCHSAEEVGPRGHSTLQRRLGARGGRGAKHLRAVANGRAMRERNPHTHWWGGWLGTTGMRDWRGVFQKILREVVWALESPCRSGRKVAFKASMGGRHLFEKMARRDDSQASTWPSWIEALCFPFGERSAKMG